MSPMLIRLTLLALAGAAGTLARYGTQVAVHRSGANPAWATGFVNVTGCLVFGLVVGMLEERVSDHVELRVIVLTGFLGAFTTFSALIGDAGALTRGGSPGLGATTIAVQVVVGAALLAGGILVGKLIS